MKCPREACGYEWTPRNAIPKACPMCKQYIKTQNIFADEKSEPVVADTPAVNDAADDRVDYGFDTGA